MSDIRKHPSSYRDPSGFIFYKDHKLYRQVNKVFQTEFDKFQSGGLYDALVEKKLLIPHTLVNDNILADDNWLTTLLPEYIPMVTYPAEWSFDMLKEAALLTLEIAREAMAKEMMLKDASAYNVQWHKGKMVFIDSLSFEPYDASKPWIAYRQFCEHFLAPLALMHYNKLPLHELWNAYPDGIPLALASKMLPYKTRFNLHIYLNIHLHASIAGKKNRNAPQKEFSETKMKNVLRSLEESIRGFSFASSGVWSNYYDEASQRDNYMEMKSAIIEEWTGSLPVKTAIDAGANEGFFARLLSNKNIYTIAADLDHFSINQLYKRIIAEKMVNLQPMIIDLTKPTPATGVNNKERSSFLNRINVDLVMALALIHHLSIGHNIPFESSAEMFFGMGEYLVIEFVPKEDEKVQLMLSQKKDIYTGYTINNFLAGFEEKFNVLKSEKVGSSGRTLFLMKRKG